ncbi:MAG: LysR family transcriptional regulator [Chloroflexi bacterium]|nr:LysR family transcriptional regulator [Chloroflexota bacterium]
MDVSLHQLRLFAEVAREGSFSRAAERLCISQPGVSAQIKSLERSIGQPLFERRRRVVTLTQAGCVLLRYAEGVLALLDEAQMELEEVAGGRRGAVKVAASTSAGIYVVPTALGAFHRAYPDVQLSLDVVNRDAAQERLLVGAVDIAIMGLIDDPAALEIAEFLPNELVVIAAPDHPLADRRSIRLAELARETLLLREAGSGTREDTLRLFAAHGLRPVVGMELRSSGATKQAVAAGLGVAIMPLAALELELRSQRLVLLDVTGFPLWRHWSLVRRAGAHHSAAACALWEFLLAHRDEVACSWPRNQPDDALPLVLADGPGVASASGEMPV